MNAEHHRRALAIGGDALECAPADREAFVRAACGQDTELLLLVTDLLGRMQDTFDALATGGGAARAVAIAPGTLLGPYRVQRLLGEGGMGAVYLARRDDGGVLREVALKTMHRLRPRAGELARFQAEQQALAHLHHPYIAALVDVGVGDGGVPWFAMEFVPGRTITRFCDDARWSVPRRVALWLKVCEAVQYAHRNLVVHRDIKPANVLVTEDGLPKLLDFGVAKLLSAGDAALTSEFARHVTLDYATPERILRNAVSTAEDVYALGALLYELLAGARPFDRGALTFAELAQRLDDEHAPPLHACFDAQAEAARERIAAERSTGVRALRALLQGDVAAILDKALHPDADRRYASVESLADDAQRWQAGRRVLARGDSLWYAARRFAGRHRLALGAGLVSASALVLALAVSLQQTRAATEQARRATAVSGFLQELLAAPSARWDTTWRGRPDVSMAEVLQIASRQLEGGLRDQPNVRVELYASLARAYAGLSRNAEAVAQQRKALAIAERELPADSPLQHQARFDLAIMLDYVATPAALAEARTHLRRALAWLDVHRPGPSAERAAVIGEFAQNQRNGGDLRGAVGTYLRALDAYRRAGGPPDHPLLGVGYGMLGLTYLDLGDLRHARAPLERAVYIHTRFAGGPTSDALYALGGLAFVDMVDGRHARALRNAEVARQYADAILGERSPITAMVYAGNALVALHAGRPAAARAALAKGEALLRAQPPPPRDVRDAFALGRAELALAAGDAAAALRLLRPIAHFADEPRLRSTGFDHRGRWLAATGEALLRLARPAEALPLLRRAQAWRAPRFGEGSEFVRVLARAQARAAARTGTGNGHAPG